VRSSIEILPSGGKPPPDTLFWLIKWLYFYR
jgi:hypothetical protein